LDDTANSVYHKDNSLVTGIWFKDLTTGAVTLYSDNQTFGMGGAVEHLSGPTTVDKIAVVGLGNGFNGQNAAFVQLFNTSFGLIAAQASPFGDYTFYSTDGGNTFNKIATGNGPNASQFWMSKDSAGVFHYIDSIGNVWRANGDPSPTTTWTRTWQPEAVPPIPEPLPTGSCTASFHQGYYAWDAQQSLWVSKDGTTMLYGKGYGDDAAGVCRSTDGGYSFFPVDFPTPPAGAEMNHPYVIAMANDDQKGVAARSSEYSPEMAYVYTTQNGGETWTASTLPSTVNVAGSYATIAAGFWAPDNQHVWLVGFIGNSTHGLVLKSSDAGATWTDLSDQMVGLADTKLHTGFALDAENIWLGGEDGTLLYSPSGGD
jgi:photosystem II stability/assembly factor-like uncharacterized protein